MNYHIDIQSDRLSVSDTDRNINMQTVMQTCNMIIMIMIYTEGPQLAEAVFSEAYLKPQSDRDTCTKTVRQ